MADPSQARCAILQPVFRTRSRCNAAISERHGKAAPEAMDTIAAIVGALDKREMFQSIISHAGRQHAQFGAKPPHFAAFGDALLWGLEHQLGDTFTPELKEAWSTLYGVVQSEMMRAGRLQA
jgi:hemoglobin-like flavoprotein